MADQAELTKMDEKNVPTLKVIILGEHNVGKSALLYSYKNSKLPQKNLEPTCPDGIFSQTINVEGKSIKLEIWDSPGYESTRKYMASMLYRRAKAVILVYNITDRRSFESLNLFVEECESHHIEMESIPVFLLANKCDLRDNGDMAQVKYEEGKQYARAHNMIYYETSIYPIKDVKKIEDMLIYAACIFRFSVQSKLEP